MAKSGAQRKREHYQRMKDRGLVKKEVWILPNNDVVLKEIELHLRGRKCKACYYTSCNGVVIENIDVKGEG